MSTKLHSRLSSQSNQVKSKSLGKDTFNTADPFTVERQKASKPEYIVGDKGCGENTLHEIQAIIIS